MVLCIVMVYILKKLYQICFILLFSSDIDALVKSVNISNIKHITIHKITLDKREVVQAISLTDYSNRKVRRLIYALKYTGGSRAVALLAELLSDYLIQELADIFSIYPNKLLYIIPVPLSKERRKERGFSQLELLLNNVKKQNKDLEKYINYNILSKVRDTLPQTKLSKRERLHNLKGAFSTDKRLVHDAHIILVDDVLTTGSTIAETSKELLRAGATKVEVITLTFAS